MYLKLLSTCLFIGALNCDQADHHRRTNQLPDRSTIVHLFEWKWKDIADECERFLAPKGFGGVQISPPSENVIIRLADGTRPWYERYQVMSYNLNTRSGNLKDFLNMTTRCNAVGVRVYADVVVNHMTADNAETTGTGGSTANYSDYHYPGVPYTRKHFHYPYCSIDYNDATKVRNCELVGLKDLNQTMAYVRVEIVNFLNTLIDLGVAGIRICDLVGLKDLNHGILHVRSKVTEFLNNLVSLGVAGFRVDAAKHMWPSDLQEIYNSIRDLNTDFGFAPKTRPYIYQEVSDNGNEAVKHSEYTSLGDVTEFKFGYELKPVFLGNNPLKWLVSWGEQWNLSPSDNVLVFIDNHDTQRSNDVLTYKMSRPYKTAIAFMLAHPYGSTRIMSSYYFDNSDQGPPSDSQENIISPSINDDDTCGNGWVCEHRWRQIYQMVAFRNAVKDSDVQNWWDNGNNQMAFSREDKGFIVFNVEGKDLNETLQTGLPQGEYCDVITGKKQDDGCTGTKVTVGSDGLAHIYLSGNVEDMHLAIHVGKESSLQQQEFKARIVRRGSFNRKTNLIRLM